MSLNWGPDNRLMIGAQDQIQNETTEMQRTQRYKDISG
jgi:hypothetical protein